MPNTTTLLQPFAEAFPNSATPQVCRAPGRVNLIGEHTDYNGLPVLPMTLTQAIQVAFAPRAESEICLRNRNAGFAEAVFSNALDIDPSPAGAWENYCKAAVQGINEAFELDGYPGMDMLVDSDLPMGAGLSSSSALVVACALAYLDVLGIELGEEITRLELAELLADAEHYVGTRGGGMDQGVILNGAAEHACKLDFFPLRVERAPLPEDCAIVVCDSMIEAQKTGGALHRYNAGPRLCALACALVERRAQEEFGEELTLERLGDLWYGALCLRHAEAEALCLEAVPEPRMSLDAVAERLDCRPAEVREQWLGDLPEPDEGFPIAARLRHQLTEYRRVEDARDALLAGDAQLFGTLMDASHASCAQDFEISGPELDALVEAARASGALGARLTGAGFGGATVNLVPRDICDTFVGEITDRYYRDYLGIQGAPPVFVARASDAAGVV